MISEKLLKVQSELKAPKNQVNKFGGYKYRSCEDILEAVKPLLASNELTLTISDSITLVSDRVYVTATVSLRHKDQSIEVSASAREALNKKGMDESQITGAASSYARKYALNGLFLIDDTRDADATNDHEKLTDNVAVIAQHVKAKDLGWINQNWDGVIKDAWEQLNDTQRNTLNKLKGE